MTVRTLIVAANTRERMMGAHHVSERLDLLGIPHGMYVDAELAGASPAWADAIHTAIEGQAGNDWLFVLPDDAELADSLSIGRLEEFGDTMLREGCLFGDLQASHPSAPKAIEGGYGYFTTSDGFTAFGAMAQVSTWRLFLDWYAELGGCLKFDESVNVFSQLRSCNILKPTMSKVEHRLEFKSLEGNDHQNSGGKNIRRTQHFNPKADWGTSGCVHLGRSYLVNHWRFLWLMTPEQRRETRYVEAAYRVEKDKPPKTISPASSTERATRQAAEVVR